MSNKINIDNRYKDQLAPIRWGQTYRAARRNSIRGNPKTGKPSYVWGVMFYSERHQSHIRRDTLGNFHRTTPF